MAAKEGQVVVVLEEKPTIGQIPLSHITKIQDDSGAKPRPKTTPIVREALRAWAENIRLVNQARALLLTQDTSFCGLIKHALSQAIRFKQYQLKEQNPNRKAKGDRK